jgi:hypothetical protein
MPCVGKIPGASVRQDQDRVAKRWITTPTRVQRLTIIIKLI